MARSPTPTAAPSATAQPSDGAAASRSQASIASAKQKSIGVSVETSRLPTATPGRLAKPSPAMPPTRSPNSRRPISATTTAVAAWISGSGARSQKGASEPIAVESRISQPISGGLE